MNQDELLSLLTQKIAATNGFKIQAIRADKKLVTALTEHTVNYKPKNLSEMAYIILNGPPKKCEFGNNLQFNTFMLGYRKGCILGNKCRCVDKFRLAKQKDTILSKYGVENISDIPGVSEKRKQTMRLRHGVEYAAQSPAVIAKRAVTVARRTPVQKQQALEKQRSTSMERYGVSHHMKLQSQQDKQQSTNLKKYGVRTPLQFESFNKKFKQTLSTRTVDDLKKIESKKRGTNQSKYGVDQPSQIGMSTDILSLLNSKKSLADYISTRTRQDTVELLGIHAHTLYLHAKEFGIDMLFLPQRQSNFEISVVNFLTSLGVDNINLNDRTLIPPREVDIYLPDYKIAIECSGLYWHSENSAGRKNGYHSWKYLECKNRGVTLITIFDSDWAQSTDIVKSRLRNLLLLNTRKIFARNCEVREVNSQVKTQFLVANHLQGSSSSKVNVGLFLGSELVSLMTFSKPRFNSRYTWELVRFCNSLNTTVTGAAAKLLNAFQKTHVTLGDTIVSYSDHCWGHGNLYSTLGFTHKNVQVGFTYTDYKRRFSRVKFQKYKILHLVENGDNKTEWQIMQELGYDRVWDCGQSTWLLCNDK